MGSVIKKAARLGNAVSPHTWVLGKKASMGMDLGGQVLGAYDDSYKPADVSAPASPVVDSQAYMQRDRIRRVAKAAMGVQSTIRTSSTGAPYTGAPSALLGG